MSMKKAAVINMSAKYMVVVLQLVISAVLARLLTPEEYGIVAVITVFTSFFSILADLGVGNAVVQNQSLTKNDIQNIYAWSLKKAVLLGVLFALLAFPISWFYSDSVYLQLVPLLSISVVFSAANMVPNALLRKQKKFVLIGLRSIVVCIACASITITLAYFGASYYALIVNTISNSLFVFLWNLRGSGLNPFHKTSNTKESVDKIRSFSSYLFRFNIMNYFSRNLDNLLIGKFFGSSDLGYYNKAYTLMLYPINNFTSVLTPVLLPFLSERQNDIDFIYKKYLQFVKALSLVGLYVSVFCYFTSYEMVCILYGENWLLSVPCFQLLAISIWSQMICSCTGTMFQVMDRTKTQYIRGWITVGTTVSCILIGVCFGTIEYVALFVMLAYCSNFISMCYFLVHRTFQKNVMEFLKTFVPDIAIAGVLCGVFVVISKLQLSNVFVLFCVKLMGSFVVFLIMIVVTKQYKHLAIILPNSLKKRWIKG